MLLEGIHIVPGLLPLERLENVTLLELVLTIDDEDHHRDRFKTRGQETHGQRNAETYLEHFTEIRMIHDFVARRADAEGVPVIEASNFDEAVDRALELILDASLTQREEAKRVATREAGLVEEAEEASTRA